MRDTFLENSMEKNASSLYKEALFIKPKPVQILHGPSGEIKVLKSFDKGLHKTHLSGGHGEITTPSGEIHSTRNHKYYPTNSRSIVRDENLRGTEIGDLAQSRVNKANVLNAVALGGLGSLSAGAILLARRALKSRKPSLAQKIKTLIRR